MRFVLGNFIPREIAKLYSSYYTFTIIFPIMIFDLGYSVLYGIVQEISDYFTVEFSSFAFFAVIDYFFPIIEVFLVFNILLICYVYIFHPIFNFWRFYNVFLDDAFAYVFILTLLSASAVIFAIFIFIITIYILSWVGFFYWILDIWVLK